VDGQCTALAVANAAAYSSVLFDLVVLALALLSAAYRGGWRPAVRDLLITVVVLLAAGGLSAGAPIRRV
jgi:hypothetical protein